MCNVAGIIIHGEYAINVKCMYTTTFLVCAVMRGLHVDYIIKAVEHTCVM